ncbi:MAG: glycosyltransferase family 2 protein [Gammaproteobacteria bacterium]
MIDHISIVIITRNAADTLRATLDSVSAFDNVIVWDNGSDDGTHEIAQSFENVELHHAEFLGFGPSKNAACDLAQNDWVFSLDADERLDHQLVTALRKWPLDAPNTVGEILRENHFMGRAIHHGGWGNDHLVRLFHRRHHRFNTAQVHEKVMLHDASRTVALPGTVQHIAVRHVGQFLQKIDRYTEIRRETHTRTYPAVVIVIKAGFAFFRSYVLQRGFLAGWRGLTIAWSNANGVFYKYIKILADQRVASERYPPNG